MTALTLTPGDLWLLLYAGIAAMVAWLAWETGKWIFWRLVDLWGTETPEPRWADAIIPDPFLTRDLLDGTLLLDRIVHTATGVCDTKHEHELNVLTNGQTIYAWGTGAYAVDCDTATHSGTRITVPCGQPIGTDGETCWGEVIVDITDYGWTADPEQVRMLQAYGRPLDHVGGAA